MYGDLIVADDSSYNQLFRPCDNIILYIADECIQGDLYCEAPSPVTESRYDGRDLCNDIILHDIEPSIRGETNLSIFFPPFPRTWRAALDDPLLGGWYTIYIYIPNVCL